MVPSATPARSAISATREWKNPCSAITSMAASRIRWYLSELAPAGFVVGSVRFTVKALEFTWIRARAQRKSSHFGLTRVPLQKAPERLPAMAMLPLLLQREFRKSLAERREEEERIVSESSLAARCSQQLTWRLAHEAGQCFPFERNSDHAHIFSRMFPGKQTF